MSQQDEIILGIAMRALIGRDLRPSGLLRAHEEETGPGLIAGAWRDAAIGLNRVIEGVALSPAGKLRLELAVLRYRAGQAPFIIVSGGYVHPNQTPFNEALEMKRSLVRDFGIPSGALIDPHARHTTTNLRNAARIAYRYGMPVDKAMLITTDASQSAYISGTEFRDRCTRELGYQPGVLGKRLSAFDQEFRPAVESLHADARDPLDP